MPAVECQLPERSLPTALVTQHSSTEKAFPIGLPSNPSVVTPHFLYYVCFKPCPPATFALSHVPHSHCSHPALHFYLSLPLPLKFNTHPPYCIVLSHPHALFMLHNSKYNSVKASETKINPLKLVQKHYPSSPQRNQ